MSYSTSFYQASTSNLYKHIIKIFQFVCCLTRFFSWFLYTHLSHVVILYYKTLLWVWDARRSSLVHHQINEHPNCFWIILPTVYLCRLKPMSWCLLWLHASQWGLRNNIELASSILLPFVVGNVPLLGRLLSVRYVVPHMYVLLCVMLEWYTTTRHLLECPWLVVILVYMIILWPMIHAVKH